MGKGTREPQVSLHIVEHGRVMMANRGNVVGHREPFIDWEGDNALMSGPQMCPPKGTLATTRVSPNKTEFYSLDALGARVVHAPSAGAG